MESTPVGTIAAALMFAKKHYCDAKTFLDVPVIDHCMCIARQSETIAARLYQEVREDFMPDDTKESIANIVSSAILRECFTAGFCSFEDVVAAANVKIAAIVSLISRDPRLVETKRDLEFRGRVSQSPVNAQIVVLSDILCTARRIKAHVIDAKIPAKLPVKKILNKLDGDLLALHGTSRHYVLRLYAQAAKKIIIETADVLRQQKKKLKEQQLVAHYQAKITSVKKTKTRRTKGGRKNG